MSHSAEGQAFLTRLNSVPDRREVNLDDVLKTSLETEQELRKLFAQDRTNTRLNNPHVGLIDVFGPGTDAIHKTYTRVVDASNERELSGKYIMPLKDSQRRKHDEPSMVADIDEFKKNWSIFTEGSLSQLLDWSNVVAAGGAVLSALLPLSEGNKKSKRAIRKHYHSVAYPSSDVDLFLWGLTPEQAEEKIVTIYEAVRDSVPWDVTCVRTKHTISIHSQYPYRAVQIVLRLYHSPAEILAGFDVDAPCCAFDGERVWVNPRAAMAMMRQCNTIDVTRRSPSYEVRLAKYASRGFEIYVPNLKRSEVDPTIYERSIVKIHGLARLLSLEKLQTADARYTFLDSRRDLRGRPFPLRKSGNKKKRKYKGDLKTEVGGLEMNDYDVASLYIPYGPGWNAQRIERLIYQTDLGMNSTFNPKNKGRRLHRHPAFFGTIEECMEDCCEHCPEPIDDDERTLQKEEDENYIRGRISFIQENPGRQTMSGSFNPIDEGEWSEQVYVRPIQKLFDAIAAHDIDLVRKLFNENKVVRTIDLKNRDHVGRTALHLAILVKDEGIAKLLVDEGCRMIARLVDGRTALHLAAQYGLTSLIEVMLEKSKENKEAAKNRAEEKEKGDNEQLESKADSTAMDVDRPSSEDDWSSDENDDKAVEEEGSEEDSDDCNGLENDGSKKETQKKEDSGPDGEVPEDEEEEPDVLDVNAIDWDQGFAALHYAVLYSTRSTVGVLLKYGADLNQAAVTPATNYWDRDKTILPLFLTLVRADEDTTVDIAECLLEAGASSSAADAELFTVLHYAVFAGRLKLLDALLRKDPGAKKALDFPSVRNGNSRFPVVSAIATGAYAGLLTLLAHEAKLNPTAADVIRAKAISGKTDTRIWGYGYANAEDYSTTIYRPVESALAMGDHIIGALLELDAEFNIGTFSSRRAYISPEEKKTILDWVVDALNTLAGRIKDLNKELDLLNERNIEDLYAPPAKIDSWMEYLDDYSKRHVATYTRGLDERHDKEKKEKLQKLESFERLKGYLQQVRSTLELKGAKTWIQVYGDHESTEEDTRRRHLTPRTQISASDEQPKPRYAIVSTGYRREWVQHDLSGRYDELFEAAFKGDDAKIENLCVPSGEESDIVPLQITVECAMPESGTKVGVSRTGLTPLYAAIAGKQWNTAKLIMGIAAAQYHNEGDDGEERLQATLFELVDEDEEFMSDDDSDCSDSTVNNRRQEVKFVDIAKKITLRTDIHPSVLFNASISYIFNDKIVSATLLKKAVQENNFEAFFNLLNIEALIKTTPYTQEDTLFRSILEADNPKFLDELIRRTGIGIDVESIRRTSDNDHPTVLNDKNRFYLGLNIHGKKRVDLARRGDPNAPGDSKHIPIVWDAVTAGAKSIIEYLASEKPLAAYKYHGTNGEGDRAEWLRHSKSVETSLSEWLGWNVSPVGESPLTMAVLRNQKDVLSVLFTKATKLMNSALHTKIKFVELNLLSLAAAKGCDKEIFDFLLKKGVSALQSDSEKGWNIYHWICLIQQGELLEYLLERLPRDISEELLAQRSKRKLNTPLQIAVKLGALRLVKAILNFTQNDLLAYDAHGFTPLHNAVRSGYSLIAEEILKFVPQDGLYLENGVGKTPYEDAEKRAMKPITESISVTSPLTLSSVTDIHVPELDASELEKELQSITETAARLADNRTLEKGSLLAKTFEKFVSDARDRLARVKAAKSEAEENRDKENKDTTDTKDSVATLETITKAVGGNEAKRILIHLEHVQLSVQADLDRCSYVGAAYDRHEFDEEDQESKEKVTGVVYREIPNSRNM